MWLGMWRRAAFNSQSCTVLNPCPVTSPAWFLSFLLGIARGPFHGEVTPCSCVLNMATYRIQWSLHSQEVCILCSSQIRWGWGAFLFFILFPWNVLFHSLEDWSPLPRGWNASCLEKKLAGTALQDVIAEMFGGKRNQGRSWRCNVPIFFSTVGEK